MDGVLLCVLSWLLLGAPTAAVFYRRKKWDLGVAILPFAGAISLTMPWIVSALTGSSVVGTAGWLWQAALASLVLAGAVELLVGRGKAEPTVQRPAPGDIVPWVLAGAAVALVAGMNIYTGLVLSRGWPGYLWDGYSIWLARAKVLADSNTFPPVATGVWLGSASHFEYPLLFPALLGWFRRAGAWEICHLPLALGLLAGLIPVAGWIGLARRLGPGWAGAVVLAPFAVVGLQRYHYGAYADPLLVMICTIGLGLCFVGIRDKDRCWLVAGGIVFAAGVATKDEGTLWFAATLVGMAMFFLDSGAGWKAMFAGLGRFSALPAVLFGLWRLVCFKLGIRNLVVQLKSDAMAERIGTVLQAIGKELGKTENLVILLLCIVAMVFLARGTWYVRLRRLAVLLIIPTVYTTGILVVYLMTHLNLAAHMRESLDRVVFGVLPAVVAMTAFARTPETIASR